MVKGDRNGELLIIPSTPILRTASGARLDTKFVEGMRAYTRAWSGRVIALLAEGQDVGPFAQDYDAGTLPFSIRTRKAGQPIDKAHLKGADVILCSGDSHEQLHIPFVTDAHVRVVYSIEYIPETRHQIVELAGLTSNVRRAYSHLWIWRQERRRTKAFRKAAGLQANGYPAYDHYRQLNNSTLLYIDSRMRRSMLVTSDQVEAKRQRILSGRPLNFLFSGRLEPMKGAQDIVPFAAALKARRMAFKIHVYGAGSLGQDIRQQVALQGLDEVVVLHDPVDFETVLVPLASETMDIFLSCHRQSDPSCSYIESMACGLPILGYNNRMLKSLLEHSGGGWIAPLGDVDALAQQAFNLDRDRGQVVEKMKSARRFAASTSFEEEFARRMEHIERLSTALPTP